MCAVNTQWTVQHEVTHRLLTLGSAVVSDFELPSTR